MFTVESIYSLYGILEARFYTSQSVAKFWGNKPSQYHHPLDGVTNPKNKLLRFFTTITFYKEKKALAYNWERCCHLALCLWLILFHSTNIIIGWTKTP